MNQSRLYATFRDLDSFLLAPKQLKKELKNGLRERKNRSPTSQPIGRTAEIFGPKARIATGEI